MSLKIGKKYKYVKAIGATYIFNHGVDKYIGTGTENGNVKLVANKLSVDFDQRVFTQQEYDRLISDIPDHKEGIDEVLWFLAHVFNIIFKDTTDEYAQMAQEQENMTHGYF